ncbi:MAG: prenyltransferase [Methanomassiliicoccales archaeon]
MEGSGEMSRGRFAMEVLRVSYTLPFVLASVTGVAFALTVEADYLLALLIPLDVFFLAVFVNFSNDYFDHRKGVDRIRFKMDREFEEGMKEILPESFYWSGNSFDSGIIDEAQGKWIMALIAAAAVLVAIPIIHLGGWLVVLLGAIGFFLSYFYTAPPLSLGSRGLGELDVGISFTFMSFFSYFVIVREFALEPLLVALTVGLTMATVRIVDQMTGYEAHLATGEKDLSVILGIDSAAKVVSFLLPANYLLSALLALYHPAYLLLFLTLPAAIKTIRFLGDREDRFRVLRPVPEIFKVAVGNQLLIVLSLTVQTFWTFG